MQPKRAIIFDFDGTLCDSLPSTYNGTCRVFDFCKVPRPTFDDYRLNFGLPYVNYYYERGVPTSVSGKEIWHRFKTAVNLLDCEMFDDVPESLAKLRRLNVSMVIISGQDRKIILHHCQKNSITAFFREIVAEQESKVEAIKAFCQTERLFPSQAMYVGDFGSDMKDATRAGVIPVGIIRGFEPIRQQLKDAGALYCIDSLRELPAFIGWLRSAI